MKKLYPTPDNVWESIFEEEWKTSFYMLKRKVTIEGNKLRVITTPDEIEEKIEWVKGLVNSTNKRVEEYNREMKRREEAKKMRESDPQIMVREEELEGYLADGWQLVSVLPSQRILIKK